jgi:hypothetical protein
LKILVVSGPLAGSLLGVVLVALSLASADPSRPSFIPAGVLFLAAVLVGGLTGFVSALLVYLTLRLLGPRGGGLLGLMLTVALTLVTIFLEVWALGRFSSEPFYLAASAAAAVVMAGAQGLVYVHSRRQTNAARRTSER